MTTVPSPKKDQTKSASKLFSGVSAVALFLGVSAGTARAAGTTITNTITSFSVTSGQSLDFIDIDVGTVTGDITNNGTVGLATNAIAINVRNGGSVGGKIVNNTSALIQASGVGIFAAGAADPVDNIQNFGTISVQAPGTGVTTFARATGIFYSGFVTGADLTSTIVNDGTIVIGALAVGPFAFAAGDGINQVGSYLGDVSGSLITISAVNGENGSIVGTASATGTNFFLGLSGIDQNVQLSFTALAGDIIIAQTNMGSIDLKAQVSGTGFAREVGLAQAAFAGSNSTAGNIIMLADNSGTIDLGINGTGSSIFAVGTGIDQFNRINSSSTVEDITFTATNSGTIMVDALISGQNALVFVGGIDQSIIHSSSSTGDLNFLVVNSGTVDILANAIGSGAEAQATGIDQRSFISSSSTGDLNFLVDNSGTVDVEANAMGSGAVVFVEGINQGNFISSASTGDLNFLVDNSGTVEVEANAMGSGAFVAVNGINQGSIRKFSSIGDLNFLVDNSGTVDILANAIGSGARAQATGIVQRSFISSSSTGDLNFLVDNSGTVDVEANAIGSGALARATGIDQGNNYNFPGSTIGNINLTINNSSLLSINVLAQATGVSAFAEAAGVVQFSFVDSSSTTGDITYSVDNFGTIDVNGLVFGDNGTARATGLLQINALSTLSTVGNIDFTINNSGNVDVFAQGTASGSGFQNIAALAFGAGQRARATTSGAISFNFSNSSSGNMNVFASARAVGTSSANQASASAVANGIIQENASVNLPIANFNISNSGTLVVSALANASGGVTSNTATAIARGFRVRGDAPDQTATLNVSNSGNLQVNATANATNAVASATGMIFRAAVLTGSVSNAGTVSVTANAPSGSANAFGVVFEGDVNNVTFTNTGNINVLAIGNTTATAVRFAGSDAFTNTVAPGTTDVATFTNNGGTISAWVNNGGTLSHGNAINTVDAPNPVMINLEGGGSVTGNILISDDDSILVRNGSTFFDGMINTSSAFDGDLTIGSGGTFSMQVGVVSSEASAFVDTFTQTSTGTLAFNITPATTMLGQINANVVNLDGTILLNLAPGLYGNTTTFSDVVVAGTLNGTWSSVTANTNSPFLSLAALFPGDGTADLVLTRSTFNSLGGLTMNQLAASTGIETSYNVNLTGPYGTLVQDLLFMNANSFQAAVGQLNGAEHAQNMKSLLYSFSSLNYAISDRVNIGPYGTRGGDGDVIKRGDISFWARASIGFGDNDGDVEATGFDQDVNAYHAGIDFAAGRNAIFGFAAGYYKNELDFDNGNRSENDGVQLAVYGNYDIKDYYLRGIIGYGMYDAESRRAISVGTTTGTANGFYDVRVFSVHGEFGRRFEVNPNVFVTPFAAFDYADVKMDAFTETGAGGANLSFAENSVNSFSSDLGARFSTAVNVGNGGLFIPEFSVAWQHDFSDNRVALNTAFAGAANSSFQVVSSNISSDSILVNAGLTFATAGGLEFKAEYNGRFNSQYKENSVGIRLSLLFGS